MSICSMNDCTCGGRIAGSQHCGQRPDLSTTGHLSLRQGSLYVVKVLLWRPALSNHRLAFEGQQVEDIKHRLLHQHRLLPQVNVLLHLLQDVVPGVLCASDGDVQVTHRVGNLQSVLLHLLKQRWGMSSPWLPHQCFSSQSAGPQGQ